MAEIDIDRVLKCKVCGSNLAIDENRTYCRSCKEHLSWSENMTVDEFKESIRGSRAEEVFNDLWEHAKSKYLNDNYEYSERDLEIIVMDYFHEWLIKQDNKEKTEVT